MKKLGFRVWDKEDEAYLHITKNKEDGVVGISPDGKKVLYLEDGEVIILEDIIIEQYTGLKDKNGKEICVGDIVKIISEPWFEPNIGVVGFNEDKGIYDIYTIEHNKKYWAAGKDFCSCMAREGWTSEVIGNIHENPELIGGEE